MEVTTRTATEWRGEGEQEEAPRERRLSGGARNGGSERGSGLCAPGRRQTRRKRARVDGGGWASAVPATHPRPARLATRSKPIGPGTHPSRKGPKAPGGPRMGPGGLHAAPKAVKHRSRERSLA